MAALRGHRGAGAVSAVGFFHPQPLLLRSARAPSGALRNKARAAVQTHVSAEQEDASREVHPTLQLIQQRHAAGSMPGEHGDGFKLGLVVEGGGMQGIVSSAMLTSITMLGIRNSFDAVYGASAGAINATYFLAGQSGVDIYTEDLVDGRFLDLSALLPEPFRALAAPADGRGGATRPAMDLSYVLGHVMRDVRPLDWSSVLSSRLPLKIIASSLDRMRPIILDAFTSEADLFDCLAASATVPEVVGPPRVVRGERLVDAAVFEPVPVNSALRDGCTHVLVLCTRMAPEAPMKKAGAVARAAKWALDAFVKQTVLNADYMRDAWSSTTSSSDEDDIALYEAAYGCPHASHRHLGAYVLPVYAEHVGGIHPVCTDVEKLRIARSEGIKAVQRVVGGVMDGARQRSASLASSASLVSVVVAEA